MNSGKKRWLDLKSYGWPEFLFLLGAGTITGALFLFVWLSSEILEGETHEYDNRILLAFRVTDDPGKLIGPSWLKPAVLDLTALGSSAVLTLITCLVLGYLLLNKRLTTALFVLVATMGGTVLSVSLKHFIDRERPSVVPHLAEFSRSSFPSGHSMLSSVVYLTLAVMLAQTVEGRANKIYIIGAALLLTLVVGVTRVMIGVHYPTDVLAGWTAGISWALLCWMGTWALRRGRVQKD